ncbi:heme exporter protein CcmD [Thiomicrorhabdus lithotrophica]|uniref:Heme exporter protein D n=1 Tax=Thiomicrorhabdus lithotrophica TaxID=2949997 RepID=A0ABY8C8C5_9GAMM|nr:heme exporter protein CcmD [Thiomicrorhabdus lithotrophica]WEJ62216.1 heme exporter protein CcmD [Thiomicrorhabdus lithotrophica]
MTEFFNMGGYGFYVWSSFGITAVVVLANIIEPIFHHKNALNEAGDFYSEES